MTKNYQILRKKCLLAFTLIVATYSHSSAFAARFENLSIEHGLSQNTVFDMKQDKYGRLWMATYDGLNLYDGVKFTHFSSKPSKNNNNSLLPSSTIYHITLGQNGNLWLSTRNGLSHLDIHSFEINTLQHDPSNENSISNNTLRYTTLDSKGDLWIGTYGGLNKYNISTQKITRYPDTRNVDPAQKCAERIRAIFEDMSGYIWIADANKGTCRLDPQTGQFENIDYRNNLQESISIGVRSFHQDSADEIWIGSIKGLFHYNLKTGTSKAFMHDPKDETSIAFDWVQKITPYQSDYFWLATTDGLSLFNKKTGLSTNFKQQADRKSGLSSNSLYFAFQDQSGLLWIGTESAGVDKYNPRQSQITTYSQAGKDEYKLSSNNVWSTIKAHGYIWLATTAGLNRIDPNNGKVKVYQHDPNDKKSIIANNLYRIVIGQNKHLWVTSGVGISRFNIDQETSTNYQNEPGNPKSLPFNNTISILEDSNNNLILGSYGEGLALVNFREGIYELFEHDPNNPKSISDDYINEIREESDGVYLIATQDGINRFNLKTREFEHITKNILPKKTPTSSVRILKNNNLALPSPNGFFIVNPTLKTLKKYNIQDGLSNDHIYSVEEDTQGNLWLSTNYGISKINPKTNQVKNLGVFDGIQGYEFNQAGSFYDGEYIYFGGFEGLTYFKPEDIVVGEFIPPVIISDFTLPGKKFKSVDFEKPINISYKDTYFSIEFSALDFTNPQKNHYMYKLHGYDKDWIDSGNRNYSSYTNLDGGSYTFQVKAANKYGVWNDEGASINIIVTPPFWKTQWFRAAAGLSLIIIILSIYWLRVRAIHAHNKILEEEVKARTADLEETLLELGETKDALIESAHKAGMADSATGVLHNVGNLLNSVNTSAGIIRDTIQASVSNKFLKANELLIANMDSLEDFINNNPKGRPLLNYYAKLDMPFRQEQNKLTENARRLISSITSIKETIAAQHRYAKGHELIEELSIIDIIEDTLLLQAGSIGRHEIKIQKIFDKDMPKLKIQKIKLVQILLNLYKNAKESMDEDSTNENHLTIEYYRDEKNAYIKVSDTGIGIEPSDLEKVFAYGYSTKIEGHGFGLHSCANYMTEMGGRMWAESKGVGHGAAFILQLPLDGNASVHQQEHLKAG